MTAKTSIARFMRKAGLHGVVESPRFRAVVGAPMYKRMLETQDRGPEPVKDLSAEAMPGGSAPAQQTPAPSPSSVVKQQAKPAAPKVTPPRPAVTDPELSVVVPAYNVSRYIDECLRSVLDQTFESIEVIVVDDGSTDDTLAKVRKIAARDLRVTVISKVNAGLGAARNTGIEASRAPYITFVDSDDIVTPAAYETMMASLKTSGSGMAIGSIERFDDVRSWTPAWVPMVHGEDRIGVTGMEFPEMMWDVFAWNKIYEREAWDRLASRFPEGTLYEDQECTAKFFISGTPIDVLSTVVYRWRLRSDNSSITQQKTDPGDLRQRIAVMDKVEALISESDEHYRSAWRVKTLGEDFYYYLREVPRGEHEFWSVLQEAVAGLWSRCSAEEILQIPVDRRWIAAAAAFDAKDELENLLIHFEQNPGKFVVTAKDDDLVATPPVAMPEFDEKLNSVQAEALMPRITMRKSSVIEDGGLEFEGFAYVENLDEDLEVSAWLVGPTSVDSDEEPTRLPVAVSRTELDEADVVSRHPFIDHSGHAYRFIIGPDVIDEAARLGGTTQSDEWYLEVELRSESSTWSTDVVRRTIDLSAGAPLPTPLTAKSNRAVVTGGQSGPLKIIALSPRFIAADAEIVDGRELRVDVEMAYTGEKSIVHRYQSDDLFLVAEVDGLTVVRTPLVRTGEASWHARALLPDNIGKQTVPFKSYPLKVVSEKGLGAGVASKAGSWRREVTGANGLSTTSYGFLELYRAAVYASVRSCEVSEHGDSVIFRGVYFADSEVVRTQSPTFAMVGAIENIVPSRTSYDSQTHEFEVRFPLITHDADGNAVAVSSGRYIFQVLLPTGAPLPASVWVTSGVDFEASFPARIESKFVALRFAASATARSTMMFVTAPRWRQLETRRYQQQMGRTFLAPRKSGLRDAVLFESFAGSSISDSPRALDGQIAAELPELERFWTVANRSVAVPDGATPVLLHSPEWYELASSAKLLINNNNFVPTFRKAEGQVYVQTWHGTPLKKIGLDVPNKNLSLRYRQLIQREATEYWDLLLAQSPWAAETLSKAFAFDGPVIAEGYPRNDVLASTPLAQERRRLVREHLGIGDAQKAVLYAPTWRDNMKEPSGHYSRVDFLNLQRAAAKLGPEYVILYRSHSNGAQAKATRAPRGVIDVTLHPSVNDLILASDALITDYSSIMFDYVVTGRPIVFLMPDLAEYAGSTRGFYFDFQSRAPGPVVKTGDGAISAVKRLLTESHVREDAYWEFLRDFAPSDDGGAAARVTRMIVERLG